MSSLAEIEEAIAKLPERDFRSLLQHLQERDEAAWDRQIEQDAAKGKLDDLYSRLTGAKSDGGRVPLDEVLDDPQFS